MPFCRVASLFLKGQKWHSTHKQEDSQSGKIEDVLFISWFFSFMFLAKFFWEYWFGSFGRCPKPGEFEKAKEE